MSEGGATTTAASGGGGSDWSSILKALGGDSNKDSGKKDGQVMPLPAIANAQTGQSQSQIGTPRATVSLDQLLKLLTDHANLYQQAAMTPGAAVQQQTRPSSLLGF